MDTLSHALWGYALTRWRGPKTARWGAALGAAPDVLYSGAALVRRVIQGRWDDIGAGSQAGIWRRDGPPLPQPLVEDYFDFYRYTHSFVILALLAGIIWLLRKKPPWALAAWGLHIAMDIPSHERYLTPMFFPLSDWTVEGVSWSTPPMLAANFGGLAIAYALVYWRYWRRGRPPREEPWPEEREHPAPQ
ncbi:MAG TPA: hypothetical protein VGE07_20570 [Herpetosiphonaceae bacterium]